MKPTDLGDPNGTFEIESLSMSLYCSLSLAWAFAKVLFVQLTGTRIAHESNATGTKILSLRDPCTESACNSEPDLRDSVTI